MTNFLLPKHSPNINAFLRTPRNKHCTQIFLRRQDDAGAPVTRWRAHDIYVGLDDSPYIIGARLSRILIREMKTYAFPMPRGGVIEITDQFWREYERDGRCAFDRAHSVPFTDSGNRYTVVGTSRRCNWCGAWHESHIEKRVQIERVQVWSPQPSLREAA